MMPGEFPAGPVVRTWCFYCCEPGSIPGRETRILKAPRCSQKKKKNDGRFLISVLRKNERMCAC